ncbi:MAG TPA: M1 family aminopeptidase [Kofleriaceae bacterium]|nr:M1 family aminopeptidase [Kofleriaceae bacterium]
MRLSGAGILVATTTTLAACGGDDGPPPTGTPDVEVLAYGYEIDLESRAAWFTHVVHPLAPGNCIALPSRAAALELASVMIGETPAVASWDGATLTACMPPGTGFDTEPLTLSGHITQQPLETWGGSQVGYSVTNDAAGQPMFYLVSWVEGCDRFGPCDTRPGTFANYRFTVNHRAGVKVLCPGRVTPGEITTTCDFDYDGGPTYSTFGFIASPSWTQTSLGSWGDVAVTLHDRPGSGIAPLIDNAFHAGFVAWMDATFGAYPYGGELRVATGPTYWSGFEHPGNIVLDDGLDRPMSSLYARPVAHVLNHEIAHQWAGDQTTLADTYDFVWKESMAEYLSYVYEDEHGVTSEGLVTARAWKAFAQGAAYYPVPEDAERPTLLDYYGEVYGPGPMILFRQLEVLTSRQQVISGIRALLGTERAISVDDVQAALEASTGLQLDRYFDIWVRGSGAPMWPTFRIEITGAAPSQNVVVTETTPGGVLHGCNFAVGLNGPNAESAKVNITRGVDGVAVATVPTGVTWPVMSTVLDPDAQCLAFLATTTVTTTRHPPRWNPWRGSLSSP